MRAFIVAAAIAGLVLAGMPNVAAESSSIAKTQVSKSQKAKKAKAKPKAKIKRRAMRGGMGSARPPQPGSETSEPTERSGSPEPVRVPEPLGPREK